MDMFPQTDKTSGPIPANGQNEKYRPDIEVSLSFHVECVCLLEKKAANPPLPRERANRRVARLPRAPRAVPRVKRGLKEK